MAHIIDYLWLHKETAMSSTKLIVCTVQCICVHETLPALVPTNQSNAWGRILLKKLRVLLLVKKFSIFYAARSIITVQTARHLSLSSARWMKSTSSYPIFLRSILTLYFIYD